jgi:catechol 2,3-dioxygenase-like lactoylglutathione lyase family enzyme
MIHGAHFLLYSRDADADRRFLQEVLGLSGVDAGGGWMILGLPPAEIAVHPATESFAQRHAGHELLGAVVYLMCDDILATVKELERKGATMTDVQTERWGLRSTVRLPSGGELGVYQPTHPTAIRRPA